MSSSICNPYTQCIQLFADLSDGPMKLNTNGFKTFDATD